MKTIVRVFFLCSILLGAQSAFAQSTKKGFDYGEHSKMNKKAGRWGKKRVKASGHDQLNMKCDVRGSRRAARRQGRG